MSSSSTTTSHEQRGDQEAEDVRDLPRFPFTTPPSAVLSPSQGPFHSFQGQNGSSSRPRSDGQAVSRGQPPSQSATGSQNTTTIFLPAPSSTTPTPPTTTIEIVTTTRATTPSTTASTATSTTARQAPSSTVAVPVVPAGLGDEDEKAGDNGFEKVTANVGDPSASSTARPTNIPAAVPDFGTSAEIQTTRSTPNAGESDVHETERVDLRPVVTSSTALPSSFTVKIDEMNHVTEEAEEPHTIPTAVTFHPIGGGGHSGGQDTDHSHQAVETSTESATGMHGNSVGMGSGEGQDASDSTNSHAGSSSRREGSSEKDEHDRRNDRLVTQNNILSWIVAIGVIMSEFFGCRRELASVEISRVHFSLPHDGYQRDGVRGTLREEEQEAAREVS